MGSNGVGEQMLLAYRELFRAEAQLGERLGTRGLRIGASVADQWPVLHDYLQIYARGLSPAGMLVLGGRPDTGSRATGIPFTGAAEARAHLNLAAPGAARSPEGAAFWAAVEQARQHAGSTTLDGLFATVHLAHAAPFDADAPEAEEASALHVRRLLAQARPQAVVCVGASALAGLGRAVGNQDLVELARAPEDAWASRWPAGSRLSAYPWVEAPVDSPFRLRVVPVPSLAGPHAPLGQAALAKMLAYAWA